jgi:hypothetical protein
MFSALLFPYHIFISTMKVRNGKGDRKDRQTDRQKEEKK